MAVCVKIVWVNGDRQVYPVFAGSSRHWWADKPLYTPCKPVEGGEEYRYSPTFAVAFTPFVWFSDRTGTMLWSVASIALLVWALYALMRGVFPPPSGEVWSPWHERMFLTLTLGGSAVGIWSSQSNALLTALIAFGLAAIRAGDGGRPRFCWPRRCSSKCGRWPSSCC